MDINDHDSTGGSGREDGARSVDIGDVQSWIRQTVLVRSSTLRYTKNVALTKGSPLLTHGAVLADYRPYKTRQEATTRGT